MQDALDDLIDLYKAMLPDLRRRYGSVWALLADRQLVSTFPDFASAAEYADVNIAERQVLIRHTDETVETLPFVQLEA